MTHIQSIKFRSFSYYASRSNLQFKRNFISGRTEDVSSSSTSRVETVNPHNSWWQTHKYQKVDNRWV